MFGVEEADVETETVRRVKQLGLSGEVSQHARNEEVFCVSRPIWQRQNGRIEQAPARERELS